MSGADSLAAEADGDRKAQLEKAIQALESQRAVLGDGVVDAALAPLRSQLESLSGREPERRHVSVLFADVSGFTAMSETLDPEEVREALEEVWERLDAAILEHDGLIDKHIGDAVMALFGTPTAREDDPERAVRAGLAMQKALQDLRAEHAARGDELKLAMRVGIHSGPVVLGSVGTTREFTALGDTVNLASRLEGAAPVGGVLISATTRRQVRGLFELEAVAPLSLKGKSGEIEAYRVLGIVPESERRRRRGVEGLAPAFVGRAAELGVILEVADAAVQDRKSRVIALSGDAGVGKSRLIDEALVRLRRNRPVIELRGQGESWRKEAPYAMLHTILASAAALGDERDGDSSALEGGAGIGSIERSATSSPPDVIARGLALLNSLHDPAGLGKSSQPQVMETGEQARQVQSALSHGLTELLRAFSDSALTVLVLEDLQWTDASSLDLLAEARERLRDRPVLLLASTRARLEPRPTSPSPRLGDPGMNAEPTTKSHQPETNAGEVLGAGATTLHLDPLTQSDAAELTMQLLPGIDRGAAETMAARAEGNPFFLEELISVAIESGFAHQIDGRWHVDGDAIVDSLPATLVALLQARVERLPRTGQRTAEEGAVVGSKFWEAGLAALRETAASADPSARIDVDDLLEYGIVDGTDPAPLPETRAFAFDHSLLHEVVYSRVLLGERRRLHRLAAEWLAELAHRRWDLVAAVAQHWDETGDHLAAAAWHARAGNQALGAYANSEARMHLERALTLLRAYASATVKRSEVQEEAVAGSGGRERSSASPGPVPAPGHSRSEGIVGGGGQSEAPTEFALLLALDTVFDRLGDRERQTALHAEMADLIHTADDRARLLLRRSQLKWATGNLDAATELGEEALSSASTVDRESANPLLGAIHRQLGRVARDRGNYDSAGAHFEQAAQFFESAASAFDETNVIVQMGVLASEMAEFDRARAHLEDGLKTARDRGDLWNEAWALDNLAIVEACQREPVRALRTAEEALKKAEATGAVSRIVATRLNLGSLRGQLGLRQQALAMTEDGLELALEIRDSAAEVLARANRSELLRETDRPRAIADARLALEQAAKGGLGPLHVIAALSLAEALIPAQSSREIPEGSELDEALRLADEAADLSLELGAPSLQALAQRTRARLLLLGDRTGEAADAGRQAVELMESGVGAEGHEASIYLASVTAVKAAGGPDLAELESRARQFLEETAGAIDDDALRRSYLEDVPANAALRAALASRGR